MKRESIGNPAVHSVLNLTNADVKLKGLAITSSKLY